MNPNTEKSRCASRGAPVFFRWAAVVALLALPWFSPESRAAVSIFLKLDGGAIKGESTNSKHKDEIDVLAVGIGASRANTVLIPGNPAATVEDITLTKYTDKSTPELLLRMLKGTHLSNAELGFYEVVDLKEVPVLVLKLEDVLVVSHAPGGNGGEDRLIESVGLDFARFTYQTFSYSQLGALTASPAVYWDIPDNLGGSGTSNTAPTIAAIASQALNEDTAITVPFSLADAQTPTGSLTLSRSTTNPLVLPLSGITFGGSGSARNVTLSPAANASGSASVTVTVTDQEGLSASTTFTVTVNPVNDAPVIAAVSHQFTTQDIPRTVALNLSDPDSPTANLSITAESDSPALVNSDGFQATNDNGSISLTITPVPGALGSGTVTVTAGDGSATSLPVSFAFTVNPTGGVAPSDVQWLDSDPVVDENSSGNTPVGTLVAVDPDNAAEATFTLLDSAGGRFVLGGDRSSSVLVAGGAVLDYEASATHTIIVRATDPELNTFDKPLAISLANVNEGPAIITSAVPDFSPGITGPVSGISISDPDSGDSNITVSLSISAGTLHLDASGPLAGHVNGNGSAAVTVSARVTDINAVLAAGGLTYLTDDVPAGTYPLSILVDDLGNTGSGGNRNASATVNLTVVATPFDLWRQQNFPGQMDDLLVSGPLADPDNDRVANLLEYGVGSDPNNSADGPGLVQFVRETVNGTVYPALRFKRLKADLDPSLRIVAELATDDFNWRSEPGDTVTVSTTSVDERREEVVIRSGQAVSSTSRQLLRLHFTLDP